MIDDEQHCLDTLRNDLATFCPEVEVIQTFDSSEHAREWLKSHHADVIFLDIVMPGLTGFQLLDALSPVSFQVIFTTAYSEFAIKALRLSAVDYLEKPIDKDELIAAVERLKARHEVSFLPAQMSALLHNMEKGPQVRRIGLPSSLGIDFVPVDEIIYCEADGNYSNILFENGRKQLVTRSLKEMDSLLSDFSFCRIHHGYLVNLEQVRRYIRGDGGAVEMTNGETLPVSRNKKTDFLERLKM